MHAASYAFKDDLSCAFSQTQVLRDFRRKRCWARKGKRSRTPYCTSRGKGRHNLLPVMTCDGLLDWYITEGSMNSVKIRDFGKRCLVSSG